MLENSVRANAIAEDRVFYFGDNGMKAGMVNGGDHVLWSRLKLVGFRKGRVKIPHHSVSWAAGAVGIDASIECRVYRLTQERQKV
jgi:hypothetical protein